MPKEEALYILEKELEKYSNCNYKVALRMAINSLKAWDDVDTELNEKMTDIVDSDVREGYAEAWRIVRKHEKGIKYGIRRCN